MVSETSYTAEERNASGRKLMSVARLSVRNLNPAD
jgi:hypothetical protein